MDFSAVLTPILVTQPSYPRQHLKSSCSVIFQVEDCDPSFVHRNQTRFTLESLYFKSGRVPWDNFWKILHFKSVWLPSDNFRKMNVAKPHAHNSRLGRTLFTYLIHVSIGPNVHRHDVSFFTLIGSILGGGKTATHSNILAWEIRECLEASSRDN